jgi:hypothetical protein
MSVMTMLLIGLLHWAIGARLAYLTGRD